VPANTISRAFADLDTAISKFVCYKRAPQGALFIFLLKGNIYL
jgi:hypothetical protein